MKRLAVVSSALALALAALTPAFTQQPPPRNSPPTVSIYALLYLGDPALQKELKLTDAQVKKLDEQRDKIGLPLADPSTRAEATKAIDKAFADILEPAQVKRLRQVVIQQLERGPIPVGSRVLANTPEVADRLKLTDEQKAKINLSTRLTSLLTDDQKEAWKALTGEPFETALQLRGGFGGFPRASVPASVQYLLQKSVADELKLSEAQSKKAADLQASWQKEFPNPIRTPEERKKVQEMTAAVEKEVAELLDPAQNKRLKQITLQQSLANGREAAVFAMPDALKELNVTDGQETKLKSITEERRKAMVALFLTGEDSETITKKVESLKKETYAQLLAVLNDGQQAHLKDMIGEPFTGQVRRLGRGGFNPPIQVRVYLSVAGVSFAESKPLHEELRLSEVQIKQLAELRAKTQARTQEIGPPFSGNEQLDKLRAEQARDNEKALAEILQPQQLARFKQVLLQLYAQGPSPILGRFVEVSEGLKLTKEQKDRVQQGEELTRVLDEKQQAKWKEMLGPPFAKVASLTAGPVGGRGGRVTNVPLRYLNENSVREELKLTVAQMQKLPELTQKWDEFSRDALSVPPGEERARKLAEARTSLGMAIAAVLDEKQIARLHQIELQQTQRDGQGMLLLEAEVRKELDLSEDQVKQITAINQDAGKTRNLISSELFGGFDQRIDPDASKTLQEFNKMTDKKLNAVLAQVQHDKLRAMLGEPFKGEITFGFFPGPIGFGGVPVGGAPTAPAPVTLGVQITTDEGKAGALIREVNENTPAAKAGLKAGDRIKSVGGKAVEGLTGLRTVLAGFKGGEKAEIVIERDGKEEKVQVEFDGAAPATRPAPSGVSTSPANDKPGAL
jgi:hypothetical protein